MNKDKPVKIANKSLKTPSVRDLLAGRRNTKKLSPDFFENVLDQELKLKRNFTMESLQIVVDLYSVL